MKEFDDELDDLTDFDFDFEIDGFSLDSEFESAAVKTDIQIIKRYPRPAPRTVKYERAVDLAMAMPDLADGDAVYAIVSGNFIFGDFIEAFMVEKNYYAEKILIATLSLGKENVDSLKNLQNGGYVGNMSLIVSDFWFAHERRRDGGVPYIIENLSCDNFDLAAAGLHTKITLIKTSCGKYIVMHGSANLRSSRNLEQFAIENNEALFLFNERWMQSLIENFRCTNKSQRGDNLWQEVQEQAVKAN